MRWVMTFSIWRFADFPACGKAASPAYQELFYYKSALIGANKGAIPTKRHLMPA